jgi:hypothetical protein
VSTSLIDNGPRIRFTKRNLPIPATQLHPSPPETPINQSHTSHALESLQMAGPKTTKRQLHISAAPSNSLSYVPHPKHHSTSSSLTTSQPTTAPGLVDSFICNYADCRKITASMFTSAFIMNDTYLKHLRGQSNLKTFAQKSFPAGQTLITNCFCKTCGTLMCRVAKRFPGHSLSRLGTVDDFNLAETKLRPRAEIFVKDRVEWCKGVPGEGVKRFEVSPA